MLSRTEAIVAEPFAGADGAEEELTTGLVGADNAQTTGLQAKNTIEGWLR